VRPVEPAGPDQSLLYVHAQPGARNTEVTGLHNDRLRVRLKAPPADGKANEELRRFLAAKLGIAKAAVAIVSGRSSRQKRLRIDLDANALRRHLNITD
jgi:uncharacterized protein (TIGR00251 family)